MDELERTSEERVWEELNRLGVTGESFVKLLQEWQEVDFRGQNVGLSVEELNILGALSSGSFNYEELMGKYEELMGKR